MPAPKRLPKKLTIEAVMAAAQDGDGDGFCLSCGEEQGGCEPDAREYVCEACGMPAVYGAEEIVIMFG